MRVVDGRTFSNSEIPEKSQLCDVDELEEKERNESRNEVGSSIAPPTTILNHSKDNLIRNHSSSNNDRRSLLARLSALNLFERRLPRTRGQPGIYHILDSTSPSQVTLPIQYSRIPLVYQQKLDPSGMKPNSPKIDSPSITENTPLFNEHVPYEDPTQFYTDIRVIWDRQTVTGPVYSAKRINTGGSVSISVYPIGSSEHWDTIKTYISVLQSCSHRNIVEFVESYYYELRVWLVMKEPAGCTLRDILHHRLTLKQIATVCKEILQGIAYLHQCGIAHGNLKSSNVLLGPNGDVKLSTFRLGGSHCLIARRDETHCLRWKSTSDHVHQWLYDIERLGIVGWQMIDNAPHYDHMDTTHIMWSKKEESCSNIAEPLGSSILGDFLSRALRGEFGDELETRASAFSRKCSQDKDVSIAERALKHALFSLSDHPKTIAPIVREILKQNKCGSSPTSPQQ